MEAVAIPEDYKPLNQSQPEGSGVRLNLGCGTKYWPDFINIDFPGGFTKPDIECDIRTLPFHANYADEIHLIHVFEHMHRYEVDEVLAEWRRVLKIGGKLIMEMPCLDKIIPLFMNPKGIDIRLTLWGLYGNPSYKAPEQEHHWCYCYQEIRELLEKAGFTDIKFENVQFHVPIRDMRVVATK